MICASECVALNRGPGGQIGRGNKENSWSIWASSLCGSVMQSLGTHFGLSSLYLTFMLISAISKAVRLRS